MRDASPSMRSAARRRSSSVSNAPLRKSSAYPRIEVNGVRNSWEASATKRRRRASEDVRSRKAASIWLNIPLSAVPRRPTSLRSSVRRIRRVRSPPAMAPAVSVMSSRGRMPMRTIHSANANNATRTPTDTKSSMWVNDARVFSVGSSEMAVTKIPPGTATACTR